MSSVLSSFWSFLVLRVEVSFDPPPEPTASPVFIHDAVSPWRGETMLCAMMRRDLDADVSNSADCFDP